jgi:hypothetical protein
MALTGQVMTQPPRTNAPRVLVIADNGSDHRGQAAIKRLSPEELTTAPTSFLRATSAD